MRILKYLSQIFWKKVGRYMTNKVGPQIKQDIRRRRPSQPGRFLCPYKALILFNLWTYFIYKKRVLYYLYEQISELTTRNNAGKMNWWKITFPVLKFSESVGGRHQVWTSNDSTHVKVWIVPAWTRFGIWNFSLQFFHNVVKFIQYL